MRSTSVSDLMELRAERIELLYQLNHSSNARRQNINKRLMSVSRRIQKLSGITVVSSRKQEEVV